MFYAACLLLEDTAASLPFYSYDTSFLAYQGNQYVFFEAFAISDVCEAVTPGISQVCGSEHEELLVGSCH